MPAEVVAKSVNEEFFDDLFEPNGSPNRNPHRQTNPGYALMRAAIDVVGARAALREFDTRWSRLIRWRTGLDEKLELIRAVEWHYAYVFRERVRLLINEVLKNTRTNTAATDQLETAARAFKKRTDPHFTARGQHVHVFPHHDPLGSQAATLELLYKALWSQNADLEPRIRSYIRGRRQVAMRALKAELVKLHGGLMDEGDKAVAVLLPIYRKLLPGSADVPKRTTPGND